MSYSCLPNIARIISLHNKSVLTAKPTNQVKKCNCCNKESYPLKGNCLQKIVIYKYTIKSAENEEEARYIGQHNFTFRHEDKANSTKLSKYIWSLQNLNIQPLLSWEIIDHSRPFVNGSKLFH